jgi:formamidopyrimidine-DNA glycosylase
MSKSLLRSLDETRGGGSDGYCDGDLTAFKPRPTQRTSMPELPEVETTRRGIEPAVRGHVIRSILVREPRLRWRVPRELADEAAGQRLRELRRRAKYLLFDLERGTMILHLGMSGSLRLMPSSTAPALHDHIDIVLDSGLCVRFNDPRRFGSLLWTREDPLQHPLLRSLAPEPLSKEFNGAYLARAAAGRSVAIKQLIMNGQLVVGVGNIYASEALFRAGINPRRAAKRIKNAEGTPGYFRQKLYVYERTREPCRVCRTPIKHFVQGQRSTYFCPRCQR